ncbi:MAG: hypothetical protein C0615_12275 [Desulfuromonas sp.]|nr:MAG: hypothetical protein C0615_12275 [Desulfuromonas sp.]
MIVPWRPVVFCDIGGSVLMLLLSCWCAHLAWQLTRSRPDNIFRNYIFLFTLAIVFFSISRSFGHLVKQILLLNDMPLIWQEIAPFSGALNSTAFVVIFAFGISFQRFQKVHNEIENYKNNLEEMIEERTDELEKSRNTLENILNNSNPTNITDLNFNMIRANDAYYQIWPRTGVEDDVVRCYDSRPGVHCHTDSCPLVQIIGGREVVTQEVSKQFGEETRHFILTARPFRDIDGKLLGMVETLQDITLRKQAEIALVESESRFRKIFESNPDPVILARMKEGTILDVNRSFETVTGLSRQEAIDQRPEDLGLWADLESQEPFRQTLKSRGEISNYEANFRVGSGEVRTGLVSASVLRVSKEPCILLVIRDITTEKAAERTLIEMDRMKSEFISTAAHELSTPLSTMMGYTEFLRNPEEFDSFSDEQKLDFINEIYENGESLSRIISDLLDISRIESGNPIPLVLQRCNLPTLLGKKIRAFTTHNPEHRFRLELPETIENPSIQIDRQRFNQVLENLLSNAVKYSAAGTEIVLHGRELDNGWEIRVEDQGVGMNDEQIAHVFDKFYRADASNTAVSGLGLGMSVVKQAVEAHHGTIRVESAEGKGTTVIVTLPYTAE